MDVVLAVVHTLLYLFLVFLLGRLVLDYVRMFAKRWRPSGAAAMGVETVYTVTDPPLKLLRKLIKPVPLGGMSLDLGFMVLVIVVYILLRVTG